MAIDKLSLYNNALLLLGERVLSGLDENRAPRHRLDSVWNLNAVEYCLGEIKPHWSTVVSLLNTPSDRGFNEFNNLHDLPADYNTLIKLYSDEQLDQPVSRYFLTGNQVATDYESVHIRYVSNTHVTDFSNWSASFAEVVYHYLAAKLAPSTSGIAAERVQFLEELYESKKQKAVEIESFEEPDFRSRATDSTLTEDWLRIYNDALLIMGIPFLISDDEDAQVRALLDTARNTSLVEDLLEEINWFFPHRIEKLDADPALEPEWGHKYVFRHPDNMLRLRGVFRDEYNRNPLKDYNDEDDLIFASCEEIWVDYIHKEDLDVPSRWPAHFQKLVAAGLAQAVAPSVGNIDIVRVDQRYEDRLHRSKSIDANQSPPQKILSGNWVNSRSNRAHRYSGRP